MKPLQNEKKLLCQINSNETFGLHLQTRGYFKFSYFRNLMSKILLQYLPKVHKSKGRSLFLLIISPLKISRNISGIKYVCFHVFIILYPTQPSCKQIICFDFEQQKYLLHIVFCVSCIRLPLSGVLNKMK
jgi:hypothetical protein